MFSKVSFYGYLFLEPVESIIRYDILWGGARQYLLKRTMLNENYENPSEEIAVMVYKSLESCIAGVLGRFRNHEIEMGLYKKLNPADQLPAMYAGLLEELQRSVRKNRIRSFSIFGNICKYKTQTAAREFLNHMGYFILTTKPPHVYVLEDILKVEVGLLQDHAR
jgi:hypothetical protein